MKYLKTNYNGLVWLRALGMLYRVSQLDYLIMIVNFFGRDKKFVALSFFYQRQRWFSC